MEFNRTVLVPFDAQEVITYVYKSHYLTHPQNQELFNGAMISPLPFDMFKDLGRRKALPGLKYHQAFVWWYELGGQVLEHTDREEEMWSISVPLMMSTRTWLTIGGMDYESTYGIGTWMNGGREVHSRRPFKGEHMHMMLSYRENPLKSKT